MKYIPAITSAMASVLGRSDRGTYARVLRRAAAWENNGGISDMASEDELESTERIPIARAPVETNEERLRIDALQRAIEKRLRLIVSDEYKSSKIANEKELHRKNQEDLVTTKKRAKTSNVGHGDHLEIDCFDSDDDDNSSSGECAEANTGIDNNPDDASYGSVSFGNKICQQSQGGSSTSSSSLSNVEHLLGDRGRQSTSESGRILAIVNDSSNCTLEAGSSYDFDDGYESSH